ncbi:MAG: hypothetical protein WAK53_17675 [Chromatiaceae bacterium]|jgi:hypothetical protein
MYGFPPDFPLREHLDRLAADYSRKAGAHWTTPAQRARSAERAAAALRKAHLALLELQRCGGGGLLSVDPETLLRDAERIGEAAKRIPDIEMRGKVPEYARMDLVLRLHGLYATETGNSHRYTHARDTDGYHGPFIDFAVWAGSEIGIELTPRFIASTLDMKRTNWREINQFMR